MELALAASSKTSLYRSRSYFIVLFLVLMTLATFWPVQNYDFINYDDDKYIVDNPYLADGFSLKGLQWAFSADLLYDSPYVDYWQPVTLLARMLDVELFGMNPGGHHSMNLILHLLNVILLFILLKEMTGAVGRSALLAGLFAIHPLQVEPVAWITARKDLLSTFFGLLSLKAYKDSRNLLTFLFFLLALMSKPVLVTLPLVLILLDYWPLKRPSFNLRAKGPLFALSALFSVMPFIGQREIFKFASAAVILSNIPLHYLSYLGKVVFPIRLAIDSSFSDANLHLWRTLGAALLLLAFSIFAILQARRRPYLIVGWLWFLGTLIPTVGLPRIEDRFMYVPLIGLLLLFVWGVSDFFKRGTVLLFSILIPCLIPCTLAQARVWENSITLFEHALRVNPKNFVAHLQLCAAWTNRGNFKRAIEHCTEVLRLKPDLAKAHYNLGVALGEQGQRREAIRHYRESLRLEPNHFEAHVNLGVMLAFEGRWEEAIGYYREALRLRPDSPEAHNNLGNVLQKKGDLEGAAFHLNEALRLRPDWADVYNNLGNVMKLKGEVETAIRYYREALRLQPDYIEAHSNLGVALELKGQWREARSHFVEAVRLDPHSSYPQHNLAVALERQGKHKQAARHFIAAERLKGIQALG